ncbi:hypothetical protein [Nitrincola sp.]|uniref:hypothetical protein n=1 Tax=Nitrincola sp. TaxID=1926584 RepID=UPI003A925F93
MFSKKVNYSFPIIIFIFCFAMLPVVQLDGLAMMPGDIGDARLNNYFLENIYQFIIGNSDSLWHLSFFYPFPYVLGFSDNHFGTSPVYLLMRFLGSPTDTAFQIWFLMGYLANFMAAYYALRRLGGSKLAACMGAVIFTFALPTTAHVGHAQLHYRFGIPLAIVFLFDFLDKKTWRFLIISGIWLVWQFYAGIYMGFFTLLLMLEMIACYVCYERFNKKNTLRSIFSNFVESWRSLLFRNKIRYILLLVLLLFFLALLFYPYFQVSHLYGVKRSWDDISSMLPRPKSYFLSDISRLWSTPGSQFFSGIPMRHEHQMFIGLMPLFLALFGLWVGARKNIHSHFPMMVGMLGLMVILTLYVGGFSFWYFFHGLPLVSAIRAISRLDQAILFPIACLAVIGIDHMCKCYTSGLKIIASLILPLLLFEMFMVSMPVSPKEEWRMRIQQADKLVPHDLSEGSIVFMAQRDGPFFADELDAMWVSLNRGVKTLNGYSGLLPPSFSPTYGRDCKQLGDRIISYVDFSNYTNADGKYQQLLSRVVPLGFENCD